MEWHTTTGPALPIYVCDSHLATDLSLKQHDLCQARHPATLRDFNRSGRAKIIAAWQACTFCGEDEE